MRAVRTSLYLTLAGASFGCPGTIDDPTAYDNYQGAQGYDEWPLRDAATPPAMNTPDAGWSGPSMNPPAIWQDAAMTASAWDAARPAAWDASSTDERDASRPAADAASPADASTNACNFRALMQMKCGNAACHGAASPTGLDLVSEGLAQRVATRRGSDGCDDYLLVDPDRPALSALYLKVSGTTCGVRMPIGGSLSADEQACILSWIEKL